MNPIPTQWPAETVELGVSLTSLSRIHMKQIREWAEWIGFETRNKYVLKSQDGEEIGFAAEQQKGILGFLFRQWLGHWRSFEIIIFNKSREKALILKHPFRWFFQRIEVYDSHGILLGAVQQRFAILRKSFDVEDARGKVRYEVRAPIWHLWTFTFTKWGQEVGEVQKKWSGLISEVFTDRDNFVLSFYGENLDAEDRALMLGAAVFVDLQYFERKAR
jgi:uncharacterized protein YxjI